MKDNPLEQKKDERYDCKVLSRLWQVIPRGLLVWYCSPSRVGKDFFITRSALFYAGVAQW
jgi:hypothetical protein